MLTFAAARRGHTAFIYSMLVAVLLLNSPAKARNGLPSTINCVAVPCFRKCGMSAADGAETDLVCPRPAARVREQANRIFMASV